MSKRRNDNSQLSKDDMEALEEETSGPAGSFQMASKDTIAGRRILSARGKKKWTNGAVSIQPPPSASKSMQTPKASSNRVSFGADTTMKTPSNPFANTFLKTPTTAMNSRSASTPGAFGGGFGFGKTPNKMNTLNAGSTPFPAKATGAPATTTQTPAKPSITTMGSTPASLKGFSTNTPLPLPSKSPTTTPTIFSPNSTAKSPVPTVFTEPYAVADPQLQPVSLDKANKTISNIDEQSMIALELMRRIKYEFQANPASNYTRFMKQYEKLVEQDAMGKDISNAVCDDSGDEEEKKEKVKAGFSFGGIEASKNNKITLPLPSKKEIAPPTSNAFSFGQQKPSIDTGASSFAFGKSSTTTAPVSSGFSFGSKPSTASTTNAATTGSTSFKSGFSFNAAATTSADTKKDEVAAAPKPFSGFSFASSTSSTTSSTNAVSGSQSGTVNGGDDETTKDAPSEILTQEANEDEEELFICRGKFSKLVAGEDKKKAWKPFSAGICKFLRHKNTKQCWLVLRNDVGKVMLSVSIPKGGAIKPTPPKQAGKVGSVAFVGKEAGEEEANQFMMRFKSDIFDKAVSTMVEMAK